MLELGREAPLNPDTLLYLDDGLCVLSVHAPQGALPRGAELIGRSVLDAFGLPPESELGAALREVRRRGEPRAVSLRPSALGVWSQASVHPQTRGLLLTLRDDRALEARLHRLQAVAEALTGAHSLSEVASVVTEVATPAAEAEAGALLLRSRDGEALDVVGQQGYPPELTSRWDRVNLNVKTPLSDAVRGDEALYLGQEEVWARYPHLRGTLPQAPAVYLAVLPLAAAGAVFGAWQLTYQEDAAPSEQDRVFVGTLARLCALALARAQEHDGLQRQAERRARTLGERQGELRAYADAVSRDLAPPLRRIRDFADLLARRLLPHLGPDEARFFQHIQAECERVTRLSENLNAFSASGEVSPLSNVSLGEVARQAREDLAPLARPSAVDWRLHALPTVRGNAALLRGVFAALFSNALKATHGQGGAVIEVAAERGAGGWTVRVRDNGVGLGSARAADLFHARAPQYRGGAGVALGFTTFSLTNVRRSVARHGGRVWAEGAPGEGATFFFFLPDAPDLLDLPGAETLL